MSYPENLPEISINPEMATAKEIAMMAADLMEFRSNKRQFIEWLEEKQKYRHSLNSDFDSGYSTCLSYVINLAEEKL